MSFSRRERALREIARSRYRHPAEYGMQEGRFYHGYYDEYCYLPLYMFCGRHYFGPAEVTAGGSDGVVEEVARITADPPNVAARAHNPAGRQQASATMSSHELVRRTRVDYVRIWHVIRDWKRRSPTSSRRPSNCA